MTILSTESIVRFEAKLANFTAYLVSFFTFVNQWLYSCFFQGRISSVKILIIVLISLLCLLLLLLFCCLDAEDSQEMERWKPDAPQRSHRRRRDPLYNGRKRHVMWGACCEFLVFDVYPFRLLLDCKTWDDLTTTKPATPKNLVVNRTPKVRSWRGPFTIKTTPHVLGFDDSWKWWQYCSQWPKGIHNSNSMHFSKCCKLCCNKWFDTKVMIILHNMKVKTIVDWKLETFEKD